MQTTLYLDRSDLITVRRYDLTQLSDTVFVRPRGNTYEEGAAHFDHIASFEYTGAIDGPDRTILFQQRRDAFDLAPSRGAAHSSNDRNLICNHRSVFDEHRVRQLLLCR